MAHRVKDLPIVPEIWFQVLSQEDLLEKEKQRTPVSLPGEFYGHRSLGGYSHWGHKESDTTEQANTFTLPKKMYRWKITTWKYVPHHVLSGKCKLKPQCAEIPLHTTEMAKLPNTDKIKYWWGCGATVNFIPCLWGSKMYSHFRRVS